MGGSDLPSGPIRAWLPNSNSSGFNGKPMNSVPLVSPRPEPRRLFDSLDAEKIKQKARENLRAPRPYTVFDYYHEHGFFQWLGKHPMFENVTLGVICLNAVWMAVDTDWNDSSILMRAHPVFIIGENMFCAYFFYEWLVRFMAFKDKRNGLKDAWFVFDSILVFMMVMETWVFVLIAGDGPSPLGNASILRLLRLLRLSRLVRMLRSLPELMILIKGMVTAMKSVVYVMALLVIVTYVFAIVCRQLSEGTEFQATFFANVGLSMYSLIIYATFLDDLAYFCDTIREESPAVLFIIFIFICLSSMTIMNMLIGVLCEVVDAVAITEREELLVKKVREKLSDIVRQLDENNDGKLTYAEFIKILEFPTACKVLQEVDVDPVGLVDFGKTIFAPNDEFIEVPFHKFMEMVLELRSTNRATVKDLHAMNKQMKAKLDSAVLECHSTARKADSVKHSVSDLKRSTERLEDQMQAFLDDIRSVSTLIKHGGNNSKFIR
eukprot:TRINITY_DN80280_c0_g1_i1.p1 TRINITY_DN80280_c0_g1~~TRINITY_DN80280_c0_g1_i1.p1  ORF type:complete len:492 (-),score=68.35 TRINITY_DN80280_c0_g1_i1:255-1730(-)